MFITRVERRRVEVSAPFFFLFFVSRRYAHASREISLSPCYNTRVNSIIASRNDCGWFENLKEFHTFEYL